MSPVLTTLHVDMEGGWGGSSRSLFELVRRLPQHGIRPVVAYRQQGPAAEWYAAEGIRAVHVPHIASYVPRKEKALKNLVASLPRLARLPAAARRLARLAAEIEADAVHLNYEGLFLLAGLLRRQTELPILGHSRAMMPVDRWGRWVARGLARSVDHLYFISPRERDRFLEILAGCRDPVSSEIMWNITRPPADREQFASPPEAVYFGTIDRTKGTDRLIDVARELREMAAPPLRLAVYGTARTDAAFGRALERAVHAEGLGDRIVFRGYSTEPMTVMASALALVRPSRDNDPWGRDVIEAACSGLPVIASGTFDGVVRPGRTGYLLEPFDPREAARKLVNLLADGPLWRRLGDAARAHGMAQFGGQDQAAQFRSALDRLVGRRNACPDDW